MPVCGRGVEDVFPVGGWTRERMEVNTGTMSRLDADRASGSLGVVDMALPQLGRAGDGLRTMCNSCPSRYVSGVIYVGQEDVCNTQARARGEERAGFASLIVRTGATTRM